MGDMRQCLKVVGGGRTGVCDHRITCTGNVVGRRM